MTHLHGQLTRRRRRRRGTLALVVVVVAAVAAGGWWWITTSRARAERAAAEALVADFAAAFEQQDLVGIPSSTEAAAEQSLGRRSAERFVEPGSASFLRVIDGLGDAEVSVAPGPVTIETRAPPATSRSSGPSRATSSEAMRHASIWSAPAAMTRCGGSRGRRRRSIRSWRRASGSARRAGHPGGATSSTRTVIRSSRRGRWSRSPSSHRGSRTSKI